MKITTITPNMKILELTPYAFLAAVVDNEEKLIAIETFDTYDAAAAALRMIEKVASGVAVGVTIEEYLADCFKLALKNLHLTMKDIAPIQKNLAQIFTNAEK